MDPATVSDQLEIMDLIHRYALHVRSKTPAASRPLFTDDIVFEVRERIMTDHGAEPRLRSRVEGAPAVCDYIARSAGADLTVCPMIHNIVVDVTDDLARSTCLMTSRTWPPGGEVIGQYDDSFRRDAGSWRFNARIFTVYAPAPAA